MVKIEVKGRRLKGQENYIGTQYQLGRTAVFLPTRSQQLPYADNLLQTRS